MPLHSSIQHRMYNRPPQYDNVCDTYRWVPQKHTWLRSNIPDVDSSKPEHEPDRERRWGRFRRQEHVAEDTASRTRSSLRGSAPPGKASGLSVRAARVMRTVGNEQFTCQTTSPQVESVHHADQKRDQDARTRASNTVLQHRHRKRDGFVSDHIECVRDHG